MEEYEHIACLVSLSAFYCETWAYFIDCPIKYMYYVYTRSTGSSKQINT